MFQVYGDTYVWSISIVVIMSLAHTYCMIVVLTMSVRKVVA